MFEYYYFQAIANEFFIFYNRNPDGAVCLLIKFCVDVCGFQKLSVADLHEFSDATFKGIISLLETKESIDQNPTLKVLFIFSISMYIKNISE